MADVWGVLGSQVKKEYLRGEKLTVEGYKH